MALLLLLVLPSRCQLFPVVFPVLRGLVVQGSETKQKKKKEKSKKKKKKKKKKKQKKERKKEKKNRRLYLKMPRHRCATC